MSTSTHVEGTLPESPLPEGITFQQLIQRLNAYWAEQGCVLIQPLDLEVGAGTFHPATFLRALGPEPWNAAYVQPCRRPTDGRYGENPNRLQRYYQYQVAMKPSPDNIVELYFESLKSLGIDPLVHDLRLVEDNWESPTLGAWGLGWEVWLNGMEVTQFTYFQQAGGLECRPVLGEITYGLERLCMYLQNVDNVFDIVWTYGPDGTPVTYRDVYHQNEVEQSAYNFEHADVAELFHRFDACEGRGVQADRTRPAAAGLRPGVQGQPQLQPAGRAPRDQRDRAPALHPARAQAVASGGRGVSRTAREAGFPGLEEIRREAGGCGMSMRPLLIELGTEELPVKALPGLAQAFFDGVIAALDKRGVAIERGDAKPLYSPRRLAVLLPGIASEQPEQRSEVLGPYLNIALDANGTPTRALEGFAAKAGVAWDTLEKTSDAKGERFVHRAVTPGANDRRPAAGGAGRGAGRHADPQADALGRSRLRLRAAAALAGGVAGR